MARLVQLLAVLALTHVALEATAQFTGLIPTGEPGFASRQQREQQHQPLLLAGSVSRVTPGAAAAATGELPALRFTTAAADIALAAFLQAVPAAANPHHHQRHRQQQPHQSPQPSHQSPRQGATAKQQQAHQRAGRAASLAARMQLTRQRPLTSK